MAGGPPAVPVDREVHVVVVEILRIEDGPIPGHALGQLPDLTPVGLVIPGGGDPAGDHRPGGKAGALGLHGGQVTTVDIQVTEFASHGRSSLFSEFLWGFFASGYHSPGEISRPRNGFRPGKGRKEPLPHGRGSFVGSFRVSAPPGSRRDPGSRGADPPAFCAWRR